MIREDRNLLAELARLSIDVVPLSTGRRLHHRADESERVAIEREVAVGENGVFYVDTGTSAVRHPRL
jgi:hypothetical protein